MSSLLELDTRAKALLAYAFVAALTCFWGLGGSGVIHMEGMVADGGRQMLASGDWLVPRVYGEIYTYKPALAYWLAAAAHAIADPPPAWLLRLPFAASVFVMGLVLLRLVDRLVGSRVAGWCAIAAVSGSVLVEKVWLAEFDGILTAGVGVAIVAACHNLAARRASLGVWLLGYLGLAWGFLAKGVPALMLYAPGLLAAAWFTGGWKLLLDRRHVAAGTLFVVLVGGYLAGAYAAAGPAAFEQPIAESKLRGLGWSWRPPEEASARADEPRLDERETAVASNPAAALARTAAKPLLVIAAFLPWGLLLPFAASRRVLRSAEPTSDLLVRAAGGFLIAGTTIFMLVPTHSMRYYMPLCVPVGILAGITATRPAAAERRVLRYTVRSLAVAAALVAIVGGFVFDDPAVPPASRALLVLVGTAALWGTFEPARLRIRHPVAFLTLIAAISYFSVEHLGRQKVKRAKRDLGEQAQTLAAHLPDDEPVWVLGPTDTAGKNSSLYFYLNRRVVAFRPFGKSPPAGSYCVLTSDRMDELDRPPGFRFDEITRVEHEWRDFILGRCSWPR